MSAVEIMQQVIRENTTESIWKDAPLESFRRVENTNRGEIGEEFVRRYLTQENIPLGERTGRTSREDMQIAGERFEVKTASEGANGTFQFNHIRLDRRYKYLLCLGIRPRVYRFWSLEQRGCRRECGRKPRPHGRRSIRHVQIDEESGRPRQHRQVAGVDSGDARGCPVFFGGSITSS